MTAWTMAVEALPYLVITGLFGVVIAHYRKIQSGDLLPRATVDQIITQHDEQLSAARQDATDRVLAMRAAAGVEESEALRLAAGIERDAEHPVAKAIVTSAVERGPDHGISNSSGARRAGRIRGTPSRSGRAKSHSSRPNCDASRD